MLLIHNTCRMLLFLMTTNINQFQILNGKQQLKEILPVYLFIFRAFFDGL